MASSSSEVHRSVPFGMLGIVGALWSTAEEMRWAFSRADVVPGICSARIPCQRLRTQMLMTRAGSEHALCRFVWKAFTILVENANSQVAYRLPTEPARSHQNGRVSLGRSRWNKSTPFDPHGAGVSRSCSADNAVSEDPIERIAPVGSRIRPIGDRIGQHARAEALAHAEIGRQVERGGGRAVAAREVVH